MAKIKKRRPQKIFLVVQMKRLLRAVVVRLDNDDMAKLCLTAAQADLERKTIT